MHYLKKVVNTPIIKTPIEENLSIHRHFYRYSRGDFIGPAISITKTKAKITLKGSHEYEDLILEVVARTLPDDPVEIKGTLITGGDISELITELGFDWKLKKSTGKTENYKVDIIETVEKERFIDSIEAFRENSYYLMSFSSGPSCKVTTKKKIPQPSKKKAEDDDIAKRIQFCSGFLTNTDKNNKLIIESALPDFEGEIPDGWKKITLTNNYIIKEIELPKNIKDTKLLRIMAIRKGTLIRTIDVDNEIIEKQYSIVV